MSITLADLRKMVLARVERTNSKMYPTDQFNIILNDSARELHEDLFKADETRYLKELLFTIPEGDDGYALPDSINWHIMRVDEKNNDVWLRMREFNLDEEDTNTTGISILHLYIYRRFRLEGDTIKISPTVRAPGDYRLLYVPPYVDKAEGETFPYDLERWKDYIVVDAAVKFLITEDSDFQAFMMQKQLLKVRINEAARNRNLSEPERGTFITAGDDSWIGRRW